MELIKYANKKNFDLNIFVLWSQKLISYVTPFSVFLFVTSHLFLYVVQLIGGEHGRLHPESQNRREGLFAFH